MVSVSESPAGWYHDPNGAPGEVRWWDGDAWTDLTMAAGPQAGIASGGLQTATIPAQAPSVAPRYDEPDPDALTGGRTGLGGLTNRMWLVIGALGAVTVLLLGLIFGGAFDPSADEDPSADRPMPTGPVQTPGPSQSRVRIIDPAAGISYNYLGEGWHEWDGLGQQEMTEVHGQYIVTQEVVPSGGRFIAQVTSGPLGDQFGEVPPGSFASVIPDIAESVRGNYYPLPNDTETVEDGEVTIDGHAAYRLEFDLTWDVEGYDSTGERACLILIDAGMPRPALLYISIPNTHAELYGIVDQIIASITVDT